MMRIISVVLLMVAKDYHRLLPAVDVDGFGRANQEPQRGIVERFRASY